MKEPIVVVGIGEMAGVFTRGLLKLGHPIFPVTRRMDMDKVAKAIYEPALVLVAVGENDLHPTLEKIPAPWRDRLGLLQNELLPRDWMQHNVGNPTVVSVWFEKKKGQDVRVLIPSPAFGKQAGLLQEALGSIDIPVRVLDSATELLFELVVKNVYIVTTNCAGLVTGGTVSELWANHRELAEAIAREVIRIQESLTGQSFDADALIQGMLNAFEGDPEHKCMGRSAPARLARAIRQADAAGLDVPRLREIAASQDTE